MHTTGVPTIHHDKIVVNDMSFCQRKVQILVKENNSAADIYGRSSQVYGGARMGASSVRKWVKHFKDGNVDIADQPCCGRPRRAMTESGFPLILRCLF